MLFLIMMIIISSTFGSSGDRDYNYIYCLKQYSNDCKNSFSNINNINNVNNNNININVHVKLYKEIYSEIHYYHNNSINIYSNTLQLPKWTCYEMCKYMCMHIITNDRIQHGYPILKYYGHWPFIRYMGLEEPASTIFSMFNAIPHVIFITCTLFKIKISIPSLSLHSYSSNYFMKPWLVFYPITALISWISAVVFHSKKTDITSLIDYLAAFVFIFYAFWIAVRRLWGQNANYYLVTIIFIILNVLCYYRIYTMIKGSVSFDDHMKLSIGLAIASVVLWNLWIFYISKLEYTSNSKSYGNKYHRKWLCLCCQMLFCLASLLEIFDFPPIYGIFDAHSLWHAATAPLAFMWYHFWYIDSLASSKLHDK